MEKDKNLYQNYLKQKLDLIFNEGTGVVFNTKLGFKSKGTIYDYNEHVIGYTLIENSQGYYNLRDKNGKLVFSDWLLKFHSIKDSELDIECYILVNKNNKSTIVDKNLKPIIKKSYDFIDYYKDGLFDVCYNDKWNLINTKGELVRKEWYESKSESRKYKSKYKIGIFSDGYALINENGKWNFIDRKGKLLSDEWYTDANAFNCGCAIVRNRYYKCNVINKKGNLLFDEWLDNISNFKEDRAIIHQKYVGSNGCNIIDTKGKLLCAGYYSISDFKEGYAVVKEFRRDDFRVNFINKQGKIISKMWFHDAYSFNQGLAEVVRFRNDKREYNLINYEGELISKYWFQSVYNYDGTWILVEYCNKYNFINHEGKLISERWFYDADNFINGYALVHNDGNKNYITITGEKVYAFDIKGYSHAIPTKNNIRNARDMKDYKVSKKIFSKLYKCSNNKNSFTIKYIPIKLIGSNHVICLDDYDFYLYDIKSQEYEYLGEIYKVIYDDNFIMLGYNLDYSYNVYMIYEGKKIDITTYYDNYLKDTNKISINPNIDIITKEEFSDMEYVEQQKFMRNEKRKNELIKINFEQDKQKRDILFAKYNKLENERQAKNEYIETIKELRNNIIKLAELKERLGNIKIPRALVDSIFISVDDHKEIMDEFKDILSYIDLSIISFKNVLIRGLDFKGSNIYLCPQDFYDGDLRNCDFTGINLDPFINFRGIDIRGAKFSIDSDPITLDLMPKFEGAIYDNETTYNGVSLVELLGPCKETKKTKIMKKRV